MSRKGQGTVFAILCIVILVAVIGLVFVLNSEPTITGRGHDYRVVLPQAGETSEEYFQRYEYQRATLVHGRPRLGPYTVYPPQDPPGVISPVTYGSKV